MTDLARYRMLIDGAWVDAGDERTFESMNPATGEPWAIIPEATAGDVDRAGGLRQVVDVVRGAPDVPFRAVVGKRSADDGPTRRGFS